MAQPGPADAVACALATSATARVPGRALVAVFASPVADVLLHFADEVGYATTLVDSGFDFRTVDASTDVVVTDHDRPELGVALKGALATPARWIGVMGSVRHPAPHVPALRALGVPEAAIERVHRPIGLNIGSKTPPEIALATLAGLLADRNGKPGGFTF